MERRVVVTHSARSSILLIHPGSEDPQFTLGLRTRNATQRGGMVTSRVSYARKSPVSTERCDWGRAGRPGGSYQPSASGSAPGAPTIWPP